MYVLIFILFYSRIEIVQSQDRNYLGNPRYYSSSKNKQKQPAFLKNILKKSRRHIIICYEVKKGFRVCRHSGLAPHEVVRYVTVRFKIKCHTGNSNDEEINSNCKCPGDLQVRIFFFSIFYVVYMVSMHVYLSAINRFRQIYGR